MFKNIIKTIYEYLFDDEIMEEQEIMRKRINKYIEKLEKTEAKLNEIENQILKTKEGEDIVFLNKDIREKAKELDNNYPKANISYHGLAIHTKDEIRKFKVDLRDFITILYSHKKFIKDNDLELIEWLKGKPIDQYGTTINKLMYTIYRKSRRHRYKRDINLYGVSEYWTPNLFSWYMREMDCENSANELLALFLAAGIPSSFIRNVCGMTYSGGGHSTIYVYDFRYYCWRHIEATRTIAVENNFWDLKKSNDKSDQLNIKDVWFSFNDKYCWHKFKTDTAEKEFKENWEGLFNINKL